MDESCSIQAPSSSCIKKNETTEVVSQKSNFEGSPQCDSPFYVGLYLYARLKIKHSILSKEIIYTVIFLNHRYYASDTNTMAGFIRYRSIINKYGFNSISIGDVNT